MFTNGKTAIEGISGTGRTGLAAQRVFVAPPSGLTTNASTRPRDVLQAERSQAPRTLGIDPPCIWSRTDRETQNSAGWAFNLKPCCNVHRISVEVSPVGNRIAKVNPDAEADGSVGRLSKSWIGTCFCTFTAQRTAPSMLSNAISRKSPPVWIILPPCSSIAQRATPYLERCNSRLDAATQFPPESQPVRPTEHFCRRIPTIFREMMPIDEGGSIASPKMPPRGQYRQFTPARGMGCSVANNSFTEFATRSAFVPSTPACFPNMPAHNAARRNRIRRKNTFSPSSVATERVAASRAPFDVP